MKYWLMDRKYWWWLRPKEKFLTWLAHRLPRKLAYLAAIRVIAHATVGKYKNQAVPELTAMEALERWNK